MKKILTTLGLITILSSSISFAAPMHKHMPHGPNNYRPHYQMHNKHPHIYKNNHVNVNSDFHHRNNYSSIAFGLLAGAITGGIIGAIID